MSEKLFTSGLTSKKKSIFWFPHQMSPGHSASDRGFIRSSRLLVTFDFCVLMKSHKSTSDEVIWLFVTKEFQKLLDNIRLTT